MITLSDVHRTVTRVTLPALLLLSGQGALAADAPAFAAPAAAAQGAGTPGIGRVVVSLVLVLALLLGGAWLTRRVSGLAGGKNPRLRMLANISLGARERAVLISVDGREVLLGVAPGNVRTLLVGDPVSTADNEGAGADGVATSVSAAASGTAAGMAGMNNADLKTAFGDILRRSLGR